MLRKFIGILDIPLSLHEAATAPDSVRCHVAASPLGIVRAMAQHCSQWVWCAMTGSLQCLLWLDALRISA